MTAIIIVSSIVLVFALLLSFSLTVYVRIKEEVSLSIGAFGYKHKFDFVDDDDDDEEEDEDDGEDEEAEKEKKKKKKRKKDKNVEGKTSSKVNEKTLGKTIKYILSIIKAVLKPTGKLLRHTRITKLSIYMTVCGEDADETAIKYGQVSMGIYNLLGQLDNLIKVKIKSVDIVSDFVSDEPQYDIYFKVKLRLCHIIWALLCMITRFLVNTIKNKR